MTSGSLMISRWFIKDTDTCAQNADTVAQDTKELSEDIDSSYKFVIGKHTL